jgi:RNA polymerase sigma-70 factor (ECF subfamily)
MGIRREHSTQPWLLEKLKDPGNEQAWRDFLARYGPRIIAWCRRAGLQDADAEEVNAMVQLRLVKAMPSFVYDPQKRFGSWLKTVVNHAVHDFWQDIEKRPGARGSGDSAVQSVLEQAPDVLDTLVQELGELENDLAAAREVAAREVTARVKRRVKPHTWQAYILTVIDGQPPAEVAAQLGMSTAAVYVAKQRVAEMLLKEGAKFQGQDPDHDEVPS